MSMCGSPTVAASDKLLSVRSDALTRDYKQRIVENRIPVSASIELTYRCNLHCGHCYCPTGERQRELTTGEIHDVIDEMADMGTLFLLMTGGDPLLRKDFPELYRHAKARGLLVTVFTNGTLIDGEIAALFRELPPYLIEISLYGLTRETYEKVVAVKGSFDRCLAGIARAVEDGHTLALKCPATVDNVHEIPELARFAKDLGVDFRYDPVILATMEGDRRTHSLRLSVDEVVALEAADVEKDRAWSSYMESAPPVPKDDRLFSCGAGKNSFHIDPYGNVQVCLMVKNFPRNLRERSLREIYYQDFPEILAIKRSPEKKCGSCSHRATCNNCPGMALWETQTNDGHVEFACQLSEVRAETYGAPSSGSEGCGSCSSGGCGSKAGGGELLQLGEIR